MTRDWLWSCLMIIMRANFSERWGSQANDHHRIMIILIRPRGIWSVTWPPPLSQQTSITGVWPEKTLPSKSLLLECSHSICFSDLKWTLFGISYPLTKMWMDWSLYPRWRQRIIQYLELNFIRRRMLTSGLRSIQGFLTQGTNIFMENSNPHYSASL